MDITNQLQTKQAELQFLGFLGIIKESVRLIGSRWRKLFLQISATFIFPQTVIALFIYGSKTESINLHRQILLNQSTAGAANDASPTPPPSLSYLDLSLSFAFFALTVALSLSAVSVVSYTVACIYHGEEEESETNTTTLSKVIRIVPKSWRRVLGTYLASFLVIVAIEVVIILSLGTAWVILLGNAQTATVVVVVVVAVAFGLVLCAAMIWFAVVTQLALVVAALGEEVYGFRALVKSKELMKGKVGVATAIYLFGSVLGAASWVLYGKFAISSVIGTLGYAMVVTLLVLFQYVNEAVLYFVCKCCRREGVEKNGLVVDLVEVSNKDGYVPVSFVKDTKLEQV